jgi:hypothetical protein
MVIVAVPGQIRIGSILGNSRDLTAISIFTATECRSVSIGRLWVGTGASDGHILFYENFIPGMILEGENAPIILANAVETMQESRPLVVAAASQGIHDFEPFDMLQEGAAMAAWTWL